MPGNTMISDRGGEDIHAVQRKDGRLRGKTKQLIEMIVSVMVSRRARELFDVACRLESLLILPSEEPNRTETPVMLAITN
jgi:hypothetical protein